MINTDVFYPKGYFVLILYRNYYEKDNKKPISRENAIDQKNMRIWQGYTAVIVHEDDFAGFINLNGLTNKKQL